MSIFKERNIGKGRKALRELIRFKRSLVGVVAWIGFRKMQREYDAHWKEKIRITEGAKDLENKVAVVVLYQPNGIRSSLVETFRHLTTNGYSILAVSNWPLSDADKNTLTPHIWKMFDRPNYGYDLGAYRDGIWLLRHLGIKPEKVILLIDSIWFPQHTQNTAINRLEQSGRGLNGLVRKTKAKEDDAKSKETQGFIEAYFYLANLNDPDFRKWWDKFWGNVKLTPGRDYLKEGKVSYALTKAGMEFHAIGSRWAFLLAMESFPNSELRRVLKYAAYPTDAQRDRGRFLLNDVTGTTWREDVLSHIRATVYRDPFYSTFPYGSELAFGLGFIKRTRTSLSQEMHQAYLTAEAAGHLPALQPHLKTELEKAVPKASP